MSVNENMKHLLQEQGIQPSEDANANAKALCGLFLTMKYGAKDVPEDQLTLAGAIRKVTQGGWSMRINSHEDEGKRVWEISAIQELTAQELDEGKTPRVVGLGIIGATSENGPLADTVNDIHFVNAFNAIVRQIDGKPSPFIEVGDVPDASEEEGHEEAAPDGD